MLHADAHGAVATHRVAGQSSAGGVAEGAVVSVHIGDQFLRDEILPIPSGHGIGIHAAVVAGETVGHNDDEFARFLGGEGFVDHRWEIDPMLGGAHPLVVAVGVAVQHVDDRIAPLGVLFVAGRKINRGVAVRGITFQISFEEFAVDFNVFDGAGLRGNGSRGK